MEKKTRYQCEVLDRMDVLASRRTRTYSTWEQAHRAAEKIARKYYGDSGRGVITHVGETREQGY